MVAQMVIEGVIPRTEDPNGLVSPGIIAQAKSAARWKAEHMGLWYEMKERATRYAESGRRCSVRDDIEVPTLRGTGIQSRHANTAAFARMLCDEVAGFEDCIKQSGSKFDDIEDWEALI